MKVLLGQNIHEQAINLLKENGLKIEISPSPEDEVVREHIADADAIIVRTATKLSRETIQTAQKLKVIGRTGAGVDNVDIKAASDNNIPVCNAPEANTSTVAEHAVCFMLTLAKDLKSMDAAVRAGNWKIRYNYTPVDISEKTLGLVGFGKIGRTTARMCVQAFGMDIITYDPFLGSDVDVDFSYDMVDTLDELFSKADFVSLHIPYTRENHHIVGKKLIEKMKKSAFLINTSRGGLVDESALARALSDGTIAGAALDVFEDEPPEEDNPVLASDKVILSPHSAALTKESSARMAVHAAQGVIDVLNNRKPTWVFNIKDIRL
ncbi:MAG: hydroxyacid dehydrogenase [Actinomycetia bacterium]|nr:hydroxyacid dehydrogenase [Actinomycetes bacterium]